MGSIYEKKLFVYPLLLLVIEAEVRFPQKPFVWQDQPSLAQPLFLNA